MKKIRILRVVFSPEIRASEITAFRGAVIAKTGRDSILFHNHMGDDGFRYSYPLIQYKRIGKKAAIICIKEGVDEIHRFFEKRDWTLNLNGNRKDMIIDRLSMNQFTMNVWDKPFTYTTYNWIALNSENFEKYKQTESLADRLLLLESILTANILSFAKGIGWELDKQLQVKITDLLHTKKLKLKGQRVMGFDIKFKTNAFLPNHIGLGKSVSIGFGTVKEIKN